MRKLNFETTQWYVLIPWEEEYFNNCGNSWRGCPLSRAYSEIAVVGQLPWLMKSTFSWCRRGEHFKLNLISILSSFKNCWAIRLLSTPPTPSFILQKFSHICTHTHMLLCILNIFKVQLHTLRHFNSGNACHIPPRMQCTRKSASEASVQFSVLSCAQRESPPEALSQSQLWKGLHLRREEENVRVLRSQGVVQNQE